jgi:hypothetical protein
LFVQHLHILKTTIYTLGGLQGKKKDVEFLANRRSALWATLVLFILLQPCMDLPETDKSSWYSYHILFPRMHFLAWSLQAKFQSKHQNKKITTTTKK